ncbi:MAG: DegT/DnrJ/EryC1/StrS family aminotransferase [Proteobacteria bacterium]|nr:DegT/DnrJ/EryC1/StrS family aminotransferase [Pseudomonadota bacterium]
MSDQANPAAVTPPAPRPVKLVPLAINGGEKLRQTPMPARLALGDDEARMVQQVLSYYRDRKIDPGYQGPFENLYTEAFADMMGGGYADAVATGTSALYVALAALELPKGSEVLVSPITDPGTLAAIVLNGLKPRLMDSMPGSYNVGLQQFVERIGPNVTGACIVHAAGQAVEIDKIVDAARANGIKVLEDCSQAHFAKLHGRAVGTFGDIAAFSTMYRKAHSTGPSGGVVYTRDRDMANKAAAYSDRGKPRWRDDFDDRNPATYLFPALNHHTDEISCAIGYASLLRLNKTIINRLAFVSDFVARIWDGSNVCSAYRFSPTDSPFFYPVIVDRDAITCTKTQFAEAVRAEGIDLNPDYKYLVRDWPYIQPYLADDFETTNARAIRDTSFNLYLNENYGEQESRDAARAISKVEKHFLKG